MTFKYDVCDNLVTMRRCRPSRVPWFPPLVPDQMQSLGGRGMGWAGGFAAKPVLQQQTSVAPALQNIRPRISSYMHMTCKRKIMYRRPSSQCKPQHSFSLKRGQAGAAAQGSGRAGCTPRGHRSYERGRVRFPLGLGSKSLKAQRNTQANGLQAFAVAGQKGSASVPPQPTGARAVS